MKAKNYRLPGIVLALALALQSPAAQVISVKVDTGSRPTPGVVNHNCRLYAAISNDLPAGLLQRQLVDDPNSLKRLAASDNIDGWGIAYYPDYRATPTIRRGAETAYTDTDYNTLVGQINTSEPKITLAHIRNCTSGCCCHGCYTIGDPHPFYRDKNGTRWTFAHNGVLDKDRLMSVIDQDYLARNPFNGSNIPACDPTEPELVVSSELYFTLLLQHIEANGWNVVNGIAEAIKAAETTGDYGSANFVMSDGSTVWAFRRGSGDYYTMHYVHGSNYTAVASQYTSDSQGSWQPIEDYELLVLTGGGVSLSVPDVRDYPSLLVYPYLGKTTPTSVVISWATDNAGAGEVRYSLNQSYSSLVAATENTRDGKYWHSATITGLTANTTYHYKVYTGGYDVTPWPDITFTTASESTTSPLTFVVVGDSQPDSASSPPSQGALNVAAEMDQHSFDLALRTGDMVYSGGICSGDNSSWNQYIRAYFDLYRQSTSHVPFYPSVGNHELNGGSCGYQGYTDVYDLPGNAPSGDREEYYSFDRGNAHFVALDTNQNYVADSTQYNWLVQDLQASTQPWKIVFFHHPAYSSGANGSTSAVQTSLVPIFETYGVSVVFNGHDHDYERTCPIRNGGCTTLQDGGVIYYVTGGGGAALDSVSGNWFTAYSASRNHFLMAQINDCRLSLDATDTNGNVFDSYELNRCANQAPVVGDIPDQRIAQGQAFRTINLDDYVSDFDYTDAEITWTYSGNSALTVTIVDRVATIGIPNPDWNGSETITFTARDPAGRSDSDNATFTVGPANGPPVAVNDSYTTNEDTPLSIAAPGVLGNDSDVDSDTLTAVRVSNPSHGTLTLNSNGRFTYTPDANWNGTDNFTYKANDGALDSNIATVSITVRPVNDRPSFTKGADQTVLEDSGSRTVSAWARNISPGPASESGQTLTFILTTDNPALFAVAPAVNPANGNLTFTPASNMNGSATVTVTLKDGGGTANGGVDTSAPQTFRITVTPVNDAPSFTKGADQTVLEDAGSRTVSAWARNISPGPASESGQTLTFILTTNNPALFAVAPAVNPANGNLTFTPAPDMNGSATVTVTLRDGGGTANGGVDTSAPQTFRIIVTPANDAPSFTRGADQTVLEDSGVQTVSAWARNISPGPASESGQTLTFILTTDNPALFAVAPAVNPTDGNLTFTPAPDMHGSATVTVTLKDSGGMANGGVDTSAPQRFLVTVFHPMPAITSLSSTTVTVASAPFTLTITGDGFVTDSRVYWNGAVRATTFVSATQLEAAISSEDLTRVGTISVAVFNPEPGGGMSEGAPLTVADAKLYIPIVARNSVSAPDLVEDGTALLDLNRR